MQLDPPERGILDDRNFVAGPVGLLITVAEAAFAVRAAVRAISRWRADRKLRRGALRR